MLRAGITAYGPDGPRGRRLHPRAKAVSSGGGDWADEPPECRVPVLWGTSSASIAIVGPRCTSRGRQTPSGLRTVAVVAVTDRCLRAGSPASAGCGPRRSPLGAAWHG